MSADAPQLAARSYLALLEAAGRLEGGCAVPRGAIARGAVAEEGVGGDAVADEDAWGGSEEDGRTWPSR